MKIYFACPTGQRRDMIVEKYGDTFGACLTRDIFNDITATKMSYFLDNGAFAPADSFGHLARSIRTV